MVNATTIAKVKAHLGGTIDATNEALLVTLLDSVSREIEARLGYPLALAQRTETYDLDLNDRLIFLRVVPVVTVDEVKVGPSNWDFASLTALTANQDYRLGRDGQLYLNIRADAGFQRAQVIYTAGLGTTDAAVAAAAPNLALAAETQVCEEWRRRNSPATISEPTPKGSRTVASPHRLLPRVLDLLAPLERVVLV